MHYILRLKSCKALAFTFAFCYYFIVNKFTNTVHGIMAVQNKTVGFLSALNVRFCIMCLHSGRT